MNQQTSHSGNYGFLAGLLAGTVVGAGIALWLAPEATAEVRGRFNASARRLGEDLRSKGNDLRSKADDIRDNVASAVARSAHDVEEFAVAVKTERRVL